MPSMDVIKHQLIQSVKNHVAGLAINPELLNIDLGAAYAVMYDTTRATDTSCTLQFIDPRTTPAQKRVFEIKVTEKQT